ncbi:DMT(drug/metabolite transporter) superfamily permease [Rivularia sp. PCC 7116]|uniref:EamA family transporter n=1 Tax=Rivularia sp. PCC 7116 TaxID=373994 RepID=UPI00029F1B20|nr:EamA family transporter [Rivularia sp. PCC 7116]AFY56138.1 DMT(drug/metabolite transporter) superfamily permease [Rivularia sp. PCC 7116]
MGRFDNGPEKPRRAGEPYGSAESALRAVTEELQIIQRNLLKSLQDDVKRLQSEKIRLADDIKRLQEEREQLQGGRQIDELQVLMRQLAQVLGNHISVQLQASLERLVNDRSTVSTTLQSGSGTYTQTQNQESELIGNSFNNAFNTLQQDLEDYQSSISQQLSRMSLQQEQGEAILVELVNRLKQELEATSIDNSPADFQVEEQDERLEDDYISEVDYVEDSPQIEEDEDTSQQEPFPSSLLEERDQIAPLQGDTTTATSTVRGANVSLPETSPQTVPEATRQPATPSQPISRQMEVFKQRPKGLLLIGLSAVATSIYNVAIKAIFNGIFDSDQLISPTLGNCLFVLMLRMLVVVPMMLVLAPILHPRVWHDLQNLIESIKASRNPASITARRVLMLSTISGGFLFLSQVMLYLSIGQIATGMAIALLFVYPIVSGILSWLLFRDIPSKFRAFAYAMIVLGIVLVLGGASDTNNLSFGSITGIFAGISFAFYVILTRICAARLHPVSFTLINFATMLFLCFISLCFITILLPLPSGWSLDINSTNFLELILSTFILGVLTLCGYLLNNFGIRKLGATRAGLISSTVPVLTVIFAGILIQESLPFIQVIGVLLVTFGAAAFSIEKIQQQIKASRSS